MKWNNGAGVSSPPRRGHLWQSRRASGSLCSRIRRSGEFQCSWRVPRGGGEGHAVEFLFPHSVFVVARFAPFSSRSSWGWCCGGPAVGVRGCCGLYRGSASVHRLLWSWPCSSSSWRWAIWWLQASGCGVVVSSVVRFSTPSLAMVGWTDGPGVEEHGARPRPMDVNCQSDPAGAGGSCGSQSRCAMVLLALVFAFGGAAMFLRRRRSLLREVSRKTKALRDLVAFPLFSRCFLFVWMDSCVACVGGRPGHGLPGPTGPTRPSPKNPARPGVARGPGLGLGFEPEGRAGPAIFDI